MGDVKRTALRVWKSAQLYIGFHRDRQGNQRSEAKVWPPKNGNATIHANPEEQEAFLVVKAADKTEPRDVQIKFRPDKIVLRRDPGISWEGIVVEDGLISVQVGGAWIRIKSDGSVAQERDGDMTYVESDGAVLKKNRVRRSDDVRRRGRTVAKDTDHNRGDPRGWRSGKVAELVPRIPQVI